MSEAELEIGTFAQRTLHNLMTRPSEGIISSLTGEVTTAAAAVFAVLLPVWLMKRSKKRNDKEPGSAPITSLKPVSVRPMNPTQPTRAPITQIALTGNWHVAARASVP